MTDDFLLFAGSASKKLGAAIGEYLEWPLGECETIRFSEGNLCVRVLENVRGRHAFLVQGTAFPANDNFMELLFWIDALKRASAESVTAVTDAALARFSASIQKSNSMKLSFAGKAVPWTRKV